MIVMETSSEKYTEVILETSTPSLCDHCDLSTEPSKYNQDNLSWEIDMNEPFLAEQ